MTGAARLVLVVVLIAAGSAMPVFASGGVIAAHEALAHPELRGRIGPFSVATLRLTRAGDGDDARFAGTVTAAGRTYALPPPDEPADTFLFRVRSVFFPRTGAGGPAIVILYGVSQIGPGNPAERRALVYGFRAGRFVRLARFERRLDGIGDAAPARARLAAMR